MLAALRIKNLALVTDLTLELPPGFQVITGETGAGKSVLLGALGLVLGERADRGAIRSGADQCVVEAVFDITSVRAPIGPWLESGGLEPCEDNQLRIRRTLAATGPNRQFINGSPASLAQLAELGTWLVDLHGPHEHQSLLQPARQLAILDAFGGLAPARESVEAAHRHVLDLQERRRGLSLDGPARQQQLDLLRFQVAEISGARPETGEEERLVAEHERGRNAARLLELAQEALGALDEGESTVLDGLGAVGRALGELGRIDPATADLADRHAQATELLRDLQRELVRYADSVEVDPARLGELEERLDVLRGLRRKYGPSIGEVIAFAETAARRLAEIEGGEEDLARIDAELEAAGKTLREAADRLTAGRKRLLPRLARAVAAELAVLGFPKGAFEAVLVPLQEPGAAGAESVEFLFSPNPGEPPRPLRAIASSGELARVMLALKTVLAAQDDVPVLVFDEVDANVGGETARTVGERLRALASRRQVLCITHLPQVAALADGHHRVVKVVRGDRTESLVATLDTPGRLAELARMLGGGEAATRHARSLLGAGSPAG